MHKHNVLEKKKKNPFSFKIGQTEWEVKIWLQQNMLLNFLQISYPKKEYPNYNFPYIVIIYVLIKPKGR